MVRKRKSPLLSSRLLHLTRVYTHVKSTQSIFCSLEFFLKIDCLVSFNYINKSDCCAKLLLDYQETNRGYFFFIMFACPVRKLLIAFPSIKELSNHLRYHVSFATPFSYPLACCQPNCGNNFKSQKTFLQHVALKHHDEFVAVELVLSN